MIQFEIIMGDYSKENVKFDEFAKKNKIAAYKKDNATYIIVLSKRKFYKFLKWANTNDIHIITKSLTAI